jgi:ribonucleoside-diphosphate reductase alpha chain
MNMKVQKRDGSSEPVKLDKILARVKKQTYGLSPQVDSFVVAQKVIAGIYDNVTTVELDNLAAETAASLAVDHPDYGMLAGRLLVSAFHKKHRIPFSEKARQLYEYKHPKTGESAGLIKEEVWQAIQKNAAELDAAIIFDRDFNFDYFGFRTLEKSYLLRMEGKAAECPQHMYMRVAVGIWRDNLEEVLKTYELLSTGMFTHASPTLFNAGTKNEQLSSCFLLTVEDSLADITKLWSDVSMISKFAGGIGLSVSQIRAKNSYISGTNGLSDGLAPMLQVLNAIARYVNQGGKRKGSINVTIEPWHADIFDVLELMKATGKDELRARDLFFSIWASDLFFERIQADADWTLFSPDEAPGLVDSFGNEHRSLYERYEQEGRGRQTIKARDLWGKISSTIIERGIPHILAKDAANQKSNQKNIGVIRNSNLCVEIYEVSSKDQTAVCNLASIAVNQYWKKGKFDHDKLYDVAYQITKNLNRVIDTNFYPTAECKSSNLNNRPIGIGVQGLADLFALMGVAFTSPEARKLNKELFETIYFAALTASKDLAERDGAYASFVGSPASQGQLQYHMCGKTEDDLSGRWDWKSLIKEITKKGLRNSLLIANMPTASTAQILGNAECFEPFTSNIYARKVLSGEFSIVNKHLVRDLEKLGLWTTKIKNSIIAAKGSVQTVPEIPDSIKNTYKTVWEIKQTDIIDLCADRAPFIDQGQSMNLHINDINAAKVSTAIFHAWRKGLKTLCYYVRSKASLDANSALAMDLTEEITNESEKDVADGVACSLDSPEGECISCGS